MSVVLEGAPFRNRTISACRAPLATLGVASSGLARLRFPAHPLPELRCGSCHRSFGSSALWEGARQHAPVIAVQHRVQADGGTLVGFARGASRRRRLTLR